MDTTYNLLKSIGWAPKTIIDIGAYKGEWTLQTRMYFPNAQYTLVEPNGIPAIRKPTDRIINTVLSDSERDVQWFSNGSTGDSMFRERTRHYDTVAPTIRRTATLDGLFSDETFDFIKIDCQGAELDILTGGAGVVSRTECVLLECPFAGQYNTGAPTFADYIRKMDEIGFAPLDITEHHHANRILCQIDIFFLRKTSPMWTIIQSKMTA